MPNWEYLPGVTYNISVTVEENAMILFGFGLEVLDNADNTSTGQLVVTDPGSTQILNAMVGGMQRPNMVHSPNGGVAMNSKVFDFDWTAPTTPVNNVTFYFAGVAANDNNANSGDRVYSSSQVANAMPVGIDEERLADLISIHPNPAHDQLSISYTGAPGEKVQVELFDLKGRSVRTESNLSLVNAKLTGLNALPAGTYVLRLSVGEERFQQRVVLF